MGEEATSPAKSSFWTTLPGLLTAAATLVTALTAAWKVMLPDRTATATPVAELRAGPDKAPATAPAVTASATPAASPGRAEELLSAFARRTVPEEASYHIRDGEAVFDLEIREVKGKKGEVVVQTPGDAQNPARRVAVKSGQSAVLNLAGRDYLFEVHAIQDRKDNGDQAVVSLRRP